MTPDLITWALQVLLVIGVGRVWLAIDKNTESLSNLREEIPKTYQTKQEARLHQQEEQRKFETVEERVHALELGKRNSE